MAMKPKDKVSKFWAIDKVEFEDAALRSDSLSDGINLAKSMLEEDDEFDVVYVVEVKAVVKRGEFVVEKV